MMYASAWHDVVTRGLEAIAAATHVEHKLVLAAVVVRAMSLYSQDVDDHQGVYVYLTLQTRVVTTLLALPFVDASSASTSTQNDIFRTVQVAGSIQDIENILAFDIYKLQAAFSPEVVAYVTEWLRVADAAAYRRKRALATRVGIATRSAGQMLGRVLGKGKAAATLAGRALTSATSIERGEFATSIKTAGDRGAVAGSRAAEAVVGAVARVGASDRVDPAWVRSVIRENTELLLRSLKDTCMNGSNTKPSVLARANVLLERGKLVQTV